MNTKLFSPFKAGGGHTVALTALLGLSLSLALPAGADTRPVYPKGPVYGLAGIASSQSFSLGF